MTYFITGGAGSFGKRFAKYIYENTGDNVIVYSRDELKQWAMNNELRAGRIKYIIGDVRDKDSLRKAMPSGCRVVHAAALKHVQTGERQAVEAVKTNLLGTQNVVDVANEKGCEMVLISTDKAVEPVNAYGATKMLAEKITLQGGQKVVRWGNVFGSSGSILHIFKKQAADGNTFTITDERMTRFIISFDEAIIAVLNCFNADLNWRKLYIPSLRAIRIVDLAYAFNPDAKFKQIGIQPGEKLAEVISLDPRIDSAMAEKYTVDEIRRMIDGTI